MCLRCTNGSEDVLHALWGFDRLKKAWDVDFSWVNRFRVLSGSFFDLLKLIQGRPHTIALFASTTWSIWYHQNKTQINKASLPLAKISGFAWDCIWDFKNLVNTPPVSRRRVSKKLNFDGAMFGESDEAGIKVVIQNSKG